MVTSQPRKSRKLLYNLPTHLRRRQISSHVSTDLPQAYVVRSTTLRKGDRVRVMRGEFRGQEGRVMDVDTKNFRVSIEGLTLTKADQKKVPRWFHPSNLLITRFDFSDPIRAEALKATEEQVRRSEAEAKAAAEEAKRKKEEKEAAAAAPEGEA